MTAQTFCGDGNTFKKFARQSQLGQFHLMSQRNSFFERTFAKFQQRVPFALGKLDKNSHFDAPIQPDALRCANCLTIVTGPTIVPGKSDDPLR